MKQVEISEAVGCKFPEWIVFVVARGKDGKANLMPAGWCMFASGSPPMLAVAIHPKRHTHRLIEESGEFVVAYAARGQEALVARAGACSGREHDKLAELGLKTSAAAVVAAPLVEGCALAFECKLAGQMVAGDHTLFAGRIVAAHVADPPVDKIVNFGHERYRPAQMEPSE